MKQYFSIFAAVYNVLWYLQPLLCLPACRGVRRVQKHQGHQELQGRRQDRYYLALPTRRQVMTWNNDGSSILKVYLYISHLDSSSSISTWRSI